MQITAPLAVGKAYEEPTKIAIRQNRTIALLRTLIHAVPVGVALWEIIINWNTYYLGETIPNIAYYQLGAKEHEISASFGDELNLYDCSSQYLRRHL